MAALATALFDDEPFTDEEESCVPPTTASCTVRKQKRLNREEVGRFLREAEKNRRLIEKLEKERALAVLCRKNAWTDVIDELEEYEKILQKERFSQKMILQKQLVKINNGVKKFQKHLTDVKPSPELIERLKEIMLDVEVSINALTEEQCLRFEEYSKEELTCKQEVVAYERKFENWSLLVKSNPKLPAASTLKANPFNKDLPAEVKALEDFLQKTGGPHGGWDQFDHQAFLRVWMKHGGRSSYRKEAKLYLPSKTQEEIQQHKDWHQELLYLQDKKREAIQRWKTSKDKERQTRKQTQEEMKEAQSKERKVKNLAEQQQSEEEKMEVARRLEEWKKKKKRKEEEEGEQKLAEEINKRKQEKEERRRQLELKMALEEYLRLKREKEEEQEKRKREKEQRGWEEKRREATKVIKSFSERDLHKVEAKLHERQLREKEEEERQRRIIAKLKEKMDGHVNRDPSRLNRPTKGWEERMKHSEPSGQGPMLQMFHRAIPSWRQGL
ncbi:coiled-coil domain-containing protein 112 isoform X2 [Xiphophorus hellerii]|uniref:coiled-coil domain-containing protein 112 isoform X2 n=1 Tax=Xiphophorus hellerii TaxID=8084 RepID=UPI0013B4684B|nr:coiled-coil domain-containing protein 112 isoform X2 [Xiphophorus hellerii]